MTGQAKPCHGRIVTGRVFGKRRRYEISFRETGNVRKHVFQMRMFRNLFRCANVTKHVFGESKRCGISFRETGNVRKRVFGNENATKFVFVKPETSQNDTLELHNKIELTCGHVQESTLWLDNGSVRKGTQD